MLEYLKLEKAPSGVVLNKLEVFFNKVVALLINWLKTGSCSSKLIGIDDFFSLDLKYQIHTERGQYRENIEFEKTKEVLGRGNSAGDIVVIKDKVTGNEHAQKTVRK